MPRRALVVIGLAMLASRARADETTAQAAFRQADELVKQGKWAEACPLYDASYRADQQVGALLHLADCHEHVGRTATAWAEFNDAVELAHRKQDPREAYAQSRADALTPKLAKLRITPPKTPPPGLVVQRDGVDITPLVGTELPVDPGDHELAAAAPGYVDWKKKVTIGVLPATTPVQIPELERAKQPETPATAATAPAASRDGSVEVTTQPGAQIAIDEKPVGTGRYAGAIAPGRHVLDVSAAGARSYHTEIYVEAGEQRSFDVPLEREELRASVPAPPEDHGPRREVGLSIGPGEKGFADHPAVIAYRLDISHRFGARVNLGLYVEYSSINASGSCGMTLPGPKPATPIDFGPRDQFTSCWAFTPGFELFVHVLPKRAWDPWLGLAPGFRAGFVNYTPYTATGTMLSPTSQFLPGILVGFRGGVDYHPWPRNPNWAVGAFVDVQYTIIAQEDAGNGGSGDNASYVSVYGGLRTALAF